MDLSNGQAIAERLAAGANKLDERFSGRAGDLVDELYRRLLVRSPSAAEKELAIDVLGDGLRTEAIEDLCWVLLMAPEFQYVR
jgi:hypothetical protein